MNTEDFEKIQKALLAFSEATNQLIKVMADVIRESLDSFALMFERRKPTKKERHARAYYRMMSRRGLLK